MRYSLSALRTFKTVADLGNITDAAERLGRTPSTVSMALKAFEDEIGARLFQSERKGRLTPTGQFVRDRANDILSHYERAVSSMEAFARNQTGRVDLACVPSVATAILPKVLPYFRAKYPDVEIHVHDADSSSVVEAVLSGKVGLGVASVRKVQPDLDFRPLFKDSLGVVCRIDDPLALTGTSVEWEMISDRVLLGNDITGLIDSMPFSELVRKAPITVYNVLSLLALVRADVGITILPRLSISASEQDLTFMALKDPLAHRTVGLLSRSTEVASPASEAFAEAMAKIVNMHSTHLGLELLAS